MAPARIPVCPVAPNPRDFWPHKRDWLISVKQTNKKIYKPNYTEDPKIPVVSLSFNGLKNKAKAYFYEHIYV